MSASSVARHAFARLRYGADRLGWPGLLGLTTGAVAALVWLAVVLPLEREIAAQREQADSLQARLAAQTASLPEQEARAVAALPGGGVLLPLVGAVHAGAQQQQVALASGEYVWQRASGERPASYRMIFPARGSYASLRNWTAALLAAHPELALEEFDLRRADIGSETLDARVQFGVRLEEAT